MKSLFLIRLALDFTAIGLFLVAITYYLFDNTAHEVAGAGMFLLLVGHNVFNRRWYGSIMKGPHDAGGLGTKAINLALLFTMSTLLVTSVVISRKVFSFLPIDSTVTARQVHTLVAHLVLLLAAAHLGLHWSMIMGVARRRLGIAATSNLRTLLLRIVVAIISAYGLRSLFSVEIGRKLLMQTTTEFWDFQDAALSMLGHYGSIVGLSASVVHYGLRLARFQGARVGA